MSHWTQYMCIKLISTEKDFIVPIKNMPYSVPFYFSILFFITNEAQGESIELLLHKNHKNKSSSFEVNLLVYMSHAAMM